MSFFSIFMFITKRSKANISLSEENITKFLEYLYFYKIEIKIFQGDRSKVSP